MLERVDKLRIQATLAYAGSRIQFQVARGKKSSFSELFLRNLKSRNSLISGHPFYCVHSSGLWSGFMNPPNIWTALFEKETYKEKPLRLKCSKMPRICRNNPLKWDLSISRDYWFYFDNVPQSSNSDRAWRIDTTFSSSKFDPATGVTTTLQIRCSKTYITFHCKILTKPWQRSNSGHGVCV